LYFVSLYFTNVLMHEVVGIVQHFRPSFTQNSKYQHLGFLFEFEGGDIDRWITEFAKAQLRTMSST